MSITYFISRASCQ